MGYSDVAVSQREAEKNEQAWKVILIALVAFIAIGATIWFGGLGGKY
ncbi:MULTISPECIES: hypothetical protein [Nitrosomonas]|uniref:Uncharacterized protein n=1 Tax=Nitrosomonas eutropha TaxID=916 RepID=A0ABX5MEX0_9PROT|nr:MULTISPECIES: hypothetical protein [Nitrosomonas]PXV83750.1 hypothetical protein C8R14_10346 [Nitrosomonas eutropha]SCX17337.1 hypothetical protein SAMN05216379_11142 [Nitrosomonas eutropha]SDW53416.1 hypothetical protein SAMN05216317_10742 [Nitrosomonas eutropha]SEI54263.1 hypothetical protein SAMN05216318_10546 [Nitrosomonas eutropha]